MGNLAVDGDVVLGQPVGEEDGPLQRLVAVDVGEVLQRHTVDVLVGPGPFRVLDQSVLQVDSQTI